MHKFFNNILESLAKNFSQDASKMLIITSAAGWALSSLAQICGILFNPEIDNKQKMFLIPQEIADAAANIGTFLLITQMTKKLVSKMFSTGKLAPSSVRKYLNERKDVYSKKVGKLDFKLDDILKKDKEHFPEKSYYACKNLGTTIATIGAGVVSSNIITPIIRNEMAANMQKKYIDEKNELEKQSIKKNTNFKANPYSYSGNLRI